MELNTHLQEFHASDALKVDLLMLSQQATNADIDWRR